MSENEKDEQKDGGADDSELHINYDAPTTLKMYLAALVTCFGTACGGMALSYTSTALVTLAEDPDFMITQNSEEASWLGSFAIIGIAVGGLIGGVAASSLGTKRSIHLFSVFSVVGWLLIVMALNVWMIYIGRLLTGMNIGFGAMVSASYISEISPAKVRGTLGSVAMLANPLGMLLMYSCGLGLGWRSTAAVAAVIPTILFVGMFFLPESPYWLMKKNRPDDAKSSLIWLRGNRFMKEELLMIEQSLGESAGLSDLFKPSTLRPVIICASLIFFQQFCGACAVFLYASSIFAASGSSIDSAVSSCIVGIIGVVGALLSVFLTDRAGRRVLLFTSGTGMAVSLTVFGIYYKIAETKGAEVTSQQLGWLPLVCLVLFVLMFWVGFGGIPWVIMSEVLPPETKAIAGSLMVVLNGVFGFFVAKFFSTLQLWLHEYGTYWLFAGNCVLSLAYVGLYVPETKGKSLQEISEFFTSSKQSKINNV